jgi:SpoIID/LytB domain protein
MMWKFQVRAASGLDSTVMRSTFVENIRIEGGNVVMSGSGYGHGVGMCQWGARALAEDGNSPEEIVNYYYRNVQIVKMWDLEPLEKKPGAPGFFLCA